MEKKKSKSYYLMEKGEKLRQKILFKKHLRQNAVTVGCGFWLRGKGIQKKIKGLK